MRNQCWLQDGTLVKDDELYLDDGVLRVKDHITGEVREPTEAETEQFYWKPPLVFEPPETGIPEKVEYIEQFLKEQQRRE